VSHPKLLHKLQAYGINGRLFKWLSCFLSNRTQYVHIGIERSEMVSVTSGVPQGSVIGPTLFLIFINDLSDVFCDLPVNNKLFADDLKIYAKTCTDMINVDLCTALSRIEAWCSTWQLNLAIDKCNVLRISNRSAYKPPNSSATSVNYFYCLYNQQVNICYSVRDLGVLVDDELKFAEHISSIVHKAMSRANLILRCFLSHNPDLLLRAYRTYVRPVLEYCSPVWSPHHCYLIDRIENVQRYFTKRIPGMRHKSYSDRLLALRLQSLKVRRVIYDLTLCYQIIDSHIDTSLASLFTVNTYQKTRGHDLRLTAAKFTKDITKFFFTNRVIRQWNKLPSHIVHAPSVKSFKKHLLHPDISSLIID